MSVVETVLVFVVVPAAIVGVLAMLIWGLGGARGHRYRPGREWTYEPVWYSAHPLAVTDPEHSDPQPRPPGAVADSSTSTGNPVTAHTAAGGARGTW